MTERASPRSPPPSFVSSVLTVHFVFVFTFVLRFVVVS